MTAADIPPFASEGPDRVYADFLAQGQFRIQQCEGCEKYVFYPRIICPHCGNRDLTWVAPSGKGVVYSTSVPRGAPEGDYNIALIDLEEGPRMMSRVTGMEPEQVTIGMAVQAYVDELDGQRVVLFQPAEAS